MNKNTQIKNEYNQLISLASFILNDLSLLEKSQKQNYLEEFKIYIEQIAQDLVFEKDNKTTNSNNQSKLNIPKLFVLTKEMDNKSKQTEFSFQLLEGLMSYLMAYIPEISSYEEAEKLILNNILKDLYDFIINE